MKSLKISKTFTVEDIHMIREANYERQKDITDREALEDNKKRLHVVKAQLKVKGIIAS